MQLPSAEEWTLRCAADGEFRLAARHWTGGLVLRIDDGVLALALEAGEVRPGPPAPGRGVVELEGPAAMWEGILAEVPPRLRNDLMALVIHDPRLVRRGDPVVAAQYYPATMRALELLRPGVPAGGPLRDETGPVPRFEAAVGRYVHLTLGGHDHRIYFEEAGEGIPLLLQHTAGCHGSQWRHLFEVPEITSRFRLVAWDLPFHGKSLPPPTREWWSEPYLLRGELLRALPIALAEALGLERPVFMGCSVGGLLALDLALRHPDRFRAVIAVEGALAVEGDPDAMQELWHPQVSNEYKAKMMEGITGPTAPLPYRKETGFVYASGWPPSFLGDLYYYVSEFDLRETASRIDTGRVAVHILSGEYDWSGTSELGRAAHAAIAGSTWSEMKGVGHFPMCENPVRFLEHLLPVLDRIAD